jgi:hypothetical protein
VGVRGASAACLTALVMIEADFDRFGSGRRLASLNCPSCGNRLRLVGYFEVAHLAPPTGELRCGRSRFPSPSRDRSHEIGA